MKSPLISIIVPNYQGREVFPNCIRTLLAQDFQDFEIIFVDDSSTDDSRELAQKLFAKNSRVRITRTKQNSGYVGACNHAFTLCRGKYIIVTNNDATFPKNWLREMYASVKGKKNVIGGSSLKGRETENVQKLMGKNNGVSLTLTGGMIIRPLAKEEKDNNLFETFAAGVIIIPRSALKDKIFAKYYFAYGEDIELCWRLRLQGYRVVVNQQAHMHHLGSYTRKKDKRFNKRAIINGTKNRICNVLTCYEKKNIIRILPIMLLLDAALMLARPRAAWYRLKGYLWILIHPHIIYRHRREVQQTRTLPDSAVTSILSYKIHDERLTATPLQKRATTITNKLMRWYCKLTLLKTYDLNEKNAEPPIDIAAVQRR